VADVQFPCIPGYRFEQRLGHGGMAAVYLATQESLDRLVSVKILEREALQDETSKQRFENEARTIAKLTHPGIVGIHEVGRTPDGHLYYVMPYLANGDLSRRDLRDDEARIVDVLRSLLSALGYAHANGIVHRDVKEENVLFDANNRPLLTDFGIALSKTDSSRITMAGNSVGSSGYMAPEQARGEKVDGRADLYSVGVITFALLTGDLPFLAHDPLALALMHANDPVPKLPPGKRHWQGFIDRAMAKSPAQRFDNAQQMLKALDRIDGRGRNTWSSRLLRTFGFALEGDERGKRIRIRVLVGMLLAAALYFAQQRFAAQEPSAPPPVSLQPTTATQDLPPTTPPEPVPAAASPGVATPATNPDQAPTPPPAAKPIPARTRHHSAHRQPAKKRSWFSRLFHRE
jgi:serine/threonine protein kinase